MNNSDQVDGSDVFFCENSVENPSSSQNKAYKEFTRYALCSTLGLLAVSTASIIDGIVVGRFIGSEALAAINLAIPFLTFGFACVLMIAVGGSIQACHHLGNKNNSEANDSFNRSLIFSVVFSVFLFTIAYVFQDVVFLILAVPTHLQSDLSEYLSVLAFGFPFLFVAVIHYYFLRSADKPVYACIGIVIGALTNILLDILFVGYFSWGMKGAALATVFAHVVQLCILIFTLFQFRSFTWRIPNFKTKQTFSALANGFSEFINEVSAGLIIGIVNFLALKHFGTLGVSAFAVINYLLFFSIMLCYGLVDSLHILVSHNYAAKNYKRVFQYLYLATICSAIFGICILLSLYFKFTFFVRIFLPSASSGELVLTKQLFIWIWPTFLFVGVNITMVAFLNALGLARLSAITSFLRSFLLPCILLLCIGYLFSHSYFLIALSISEICVFIILLAYVLEKKRQISSSILAFKAH